jgi:hypothetical protein
VKARSCAFGWRCARVERGSKLTALSRLGCRRQSRQRVVGCQNAGFGNAPRLPAAPQPRVSNPGERRSPCHIAGHERNPGPRPQLRASSWIARGNRMLFSR